MSTIKLLWISLYRSFAEEPNNIAEVEQTLREQKILVRYFSTLGVNTFLRFTLGTDFDEQIQSMVGALQTV